MKRLLATLLLLSIPALASAQTDGPVEWSTYCDGNVEKVRCSIVFAVQGAEVYVTPQTPEIVALNNEVCFYDGAGCGRIHGATVEPLPNGDVRITWEGWLRSCLTADRPAFAGQYWIVYPDEVTGEPRYYPRDFSCDGFEPSSIIDNSTCVPLPVDVGRD